MPYQPANTEVWALPLSWHCASVCSLSDQIKQLKWDQQTPQNSSLDNVSYLTSFSVISCARAMFWYLCFFYFILSFYYRLRCQLSTVIDVMLLLLAAVSCRFCRYAKRRCALPLWHIRPTYPSLLTCEPAPRSPLPAPSSSGVPSSTFRPQVKDFFSEKLKGNTFCTAHAEKVTASDRDSRLAPGKRTSWP